ncbi:MAG: hypothetical protein ACR2PY_00115 [Salinispira sp.]
MNGLPTIIVPYLGPATDPNYQDIFVALRPETNGVLVESTMLKVLKSTEKYCSAMKLIYMANFPGEFIVKNNIIEQYYALKLHFAVMGREAFTPAMITSFENYFHRSFENSEIIGAFQALKIFDISAEELFHLWVSKNSVCTINGQSVKHIRGMYVINYDIPAIIHKNNQGTDIAVMAFRTNLNNTNIEQLFRSMHGALIKAGVVAPLCNMSRAFHYSKSPLEQILDGIAYLHTQDRRRIGLNDFTCARYLMEQGIDAAVICGILMNPTVALPSSYGEPMAGYGEPMAGAGGQAATVAAAYGDSVGEPSVPYGVSVGASVGGAAKEVNLFQYTVGMSYAELAQVLPRILYQVMIVHHGPLFKSLCPCFSGKPKVQKTAALTPAQSRRCNSIDSHSR